MLKIISKSIQKLGYQKIQKNLFNDIREDEFWTIYELCKPYTMTSIERMYSLYNSVNYVLTNNIEGDFVECGVWRGGSSMLIAKMLINRNIENRKIFLYDTFEGMSEPTEIDKTFIGQDAKMLLDKGADNKEESVWCLATIDDVQNNLSLTSFNKNNIVYIKGKVEDTIPNYMPEGKISLLRLDTDWYESTKHELLNLYPLISKNGILIIDDYGHWEGCRNAVDEYFSSKKISHFTQRIDYTGRIMIKTN